MAAIAATEKKPGNRVLPLQAEDLAALEELEHQTRLPFWGAGNYRKLLEGSDYLGWKVPLHGRQVGLAGFLLARFCYEDLEILKLGVRPAAQRMGLGSRLLEAACATAVRRGCLRCFLEVRKSNRSALAFYQRHGFRITGSRFEYYTDPVEDAWVMGRSLRESQSRR